MNSEFEWRNRMRKLGGPVEPARELWPAIAARIAAAERVPARRHSSWLALAAMLIVGFGAGLAAYHWRHAPVTATAANDAAKARGIEPAMEPRTALDWAVPDDPALVATAQNLDNASAQLQDALDQRPDAVFLVGLLNRTNAMRVRLMRKAPYPG